MLPEEALLLSLAAVLDEDELPLPNRPLHQPPPELPEEANEETKERAESK